MNTRDYPAKVHIDLQDHKIYRVFTDNTIHNGCTLIHFKDSKHIIDATTMEFLLPLRNTHAPQCYGLLKINKPNCPLYPVVSGCKIPTDRF